MKQLVKQVITNTDWSNVGWYAITAAKTITIMAARRNPQIPTFYILTALQVLGEANKIYRRHQWHKRSKF